MRLWLLGTVASPGEQGAVLVGIPSVAWAPPAPPRGDPHTQARASPCSHWGLSRGQIPAALSLAPLSLGRGEGETLQWGGEEIAALG